ncbi:hypothetical protein CHS0354_041474 [Potamilus streckersoni]|uniref:Uncharacterized protein n=1 Tax=Potamilus streckersoni TaxID=2493646 RepID=A0AAE0T9V1_9BIVA|nr:hypothetical protein CHS0354_041474 [Potamilus streckersoni]
MSKPCFISLFQMAMDTKMLWIDGSKDNGNKCKLKDGLVAFINGALSLLLHLLFFFGNTPHQKGLLLFTFVNPCVLKENDPAYFHLYQPSIKCDPTPNIVSV